jgi:GntR family transcriptional regulator
MSTHDVNRDTHDILKIVRRRLGGYHRAMTDPGPDDLRRSAQEAVERALAAAENQPDALAGYEMATKLREDLDRLTRSAADARGVTLMRAKADLGLSLSGLGARVGLEKETIQQTIRKAQEHGRRPVDGRSPAAAPRRPLPVPLVRYRRIPPHGNGTGSSFAEQVEKQGRAPSTSLERAELIEPPPRAVQWLELSPHEMVLVRERYMKADDQPVQMAAAYYPQTVAGGVGLAYPDAGPATIYERLRERGYRVTRIAEHTAARRASPDEAKVLGITTSHLILEVLRLAHDDYGRVLEATYNVFPAEQWRLAYEWRDTDD